MVKRRNLLRGVVLIGCSLLSAQAFGQGQFDPPRPTIPTNDLPPATPKKPPKPKLSTYLPENPSLLPAFQVPVGALGFTPSSNSYYLGRQFSLVSLDFLDENHLLFTFHERGGLRQREAGDADIDSERHIHAVVIALPEGKVEAESSWIVPDRHRYLWVLKGGQFLLRTTEGLRQGDSKLDLQPVKALPRQVLSVKLSPGQNVIAATSTEPAGQALGATTPASPVAQARLTSADQSHDPGLDGQSDPAHGEQGNLVMRAIRWPSGEVLHTERLSSAFNSPINSEGYVEISSTVKYHWTPTLRLYRGGGRPLSEIDSGCTPQVNFITDEELFLTSCTPEGGLRLAAVSTGGRTIWTTDASPEPVWPLLVMSPDRLRFAREALVIRDGVDLKKHPKFVQAVKGQIVRVLDAGNGKVVFEAPLSPIFDGGGNVAFSPSGRRIAILNGGAIQVFGLPLASPVPDLSKEAAQH
jgi:hypothetical protein